jgi:hypothetical protein
MKNLIITQRHGGAEKKEMLFKTHPIPKKEISQGDTENTEKKR